MKKVAILVFVIAFALLSFSFYSEKPAAVSKAKTAKERTLTCDGFCFVK